MRSIKTFIFTSGLATVLFTTAAFMQCQDNKPASTWQVPDSSKGFAVVELFTSEGCSSCPPADKLVAQVQQDNSNKPIYILAFHVDYWDHQGWKDRFSDHEYSNRQRQYADWLHTESVYTPQIVVNGATELVGSNQDALQQAISGALGQPSANSLTLTGRVEGNKVNVDYQVTGHEKRSELVLALVQKSAESRVKAGENAGSHLAHVQIVRQLRHAPIDSDDKKSISLEIPADLKQQGWELIGFVQNKADGRITAAARLNNNE
jgi:hypothetical protein